MDTSPKTRLQTQSIWIRILSLVGRVLLAVAIPLIAFYVLYVGLSSCVTPMRRAA